MDAKCFVAVILLQLLSGISSQKCGTVSVPHGNVFGGQQTKKGEWPFIVALYYAENSKFFCAGNLISTKAVLTGLVFNVNAMSNQ